MDAAATAANASLISNRSTSATVSPALVSACEMAREGWVSNEGSGPATSPNPTSSASGVRPSSSALARLTRTTAAAPSESWEALPAVIVPSGENAGRRRPRDSVVVSGRTPSSVSTTIVPLRWVIVTGTISSASVPALIAAHARSWLLAARSSWVDREIDAAWA